MYIYTIAQLKHGRGGVVVYTGDLESAKEGRGK